jgi:hypothetical protein
MSDTDDLRTQARAALEEYLAASKALHEIMGLGHKLEAGKPPPVTTLTREKLDEWDRLDCGS